MARVIHLTPDGLGKRLTTRERRAARALVGESIRTRLAEYRSRHLFARRPTQLAVFARRIVARRRTLLVVSDGHEPAPRILLTATVRASAPQGGPIAGACYAVVGRASRGVVLLATMIAILMARHGHTALSTLVGCGAAVAIVTSPLLTSIRTRCRDRALAARAFRFLPELRDQLRGVAILHDLGLPRSVSAPDETLRDLEIVGAALTCGAIPTSIAEPCCLDAAEAFAGWGGALLVPQHASAERSILVFAQPVVEATVASADIVRLERVRQLR